VHHTTCINNTSGKFAPGVNDTSGKFASGVNYTGDKFAYSSAGVSNTVGKLPPVSLTQVVQLELLIAPQILNKI
jgi:hypothetical protein